MDKMSVMLSVVLTVALAILFMPGVLAFNRGKVLRNIALWLAIFTGLALVYRDFGPDSKHPLFSLPPGVAMKVPEAPANGAASASKSDDGKTDGNKSFTPPAE
jgi:hypothetical protein